MIKENQKYLNRFFVVFDCLTIIISFIFAFYIRFNTSIFPVEGEHLSFGEYIFPLLLVTPIFIFNYSVFKLYSPFRYKSFFEEMLNIVKSNIVSLITFVVILFMFKEVHYSRNLLFLFAVISTVAVIIERAFVRKVLRSLRVKGYNKKHVLIVGYSDLSTEFIKRIKRNKQWGYNVVGVLDDKVYDELSVESLYRENLSKELIIDGEKFKYIGKIDKLESFLQENDIDEVYITLTIKEYEKLSKIINITEKYGIRTEIIPDYFKYIPARPYVQELDGLPIINIRYIPLDNVVNKFVKRVFDIVGSLMLIIIFSPIMLFEYIMIKITSPGPVIFKQERIGFNNKPFTMYKFRSMKIQKETEEQVQWTTANDPRKTKFGSFIRKTSLDELPQFFNVLFGDMSLVGPRPERPHFVDQFKEEIPKYMVKHQIRPGITGWAQVSGWRGDTSIEKRIEYDIYYLENWSLWFDIKIIFLTAFKGFINKNAY